MFLSHNWRCFCTCTANERNPCGATCDIRRVLSVTSLFIRWTLIRTRIRLYGHGRKCWRPKAKSAWVFGQFKHDRHTQFSFRIFIKINVKTSNMDFLEGRSCFSLSKCRCFNTPPGCRSSWEWTTTNMWNGGRTIQHTVCVLEDL